jgi:hypothetical protein
MKEDPDAKQRACVLSLQAARVNSLSANAERDG